MILQLFRLGLYGISAVLLMHVGICMGACISVNNCGLYGFSAVTAVCSAVQGLPDSVCNNINIV